MPSGHAATPEEMFELVDGVRTDEPGWFEFGDVTLTPTDIVTMLAPRISDERRAKMEDALGSRIDSVAVVVEGMVDLGNVGAVMRSADGFGIQRFHTIDTAGAYKRSRRTSQGADKWIDRWRWDSVNECYHHLRDIGFRIAVADVGDATPLGDVDFSGHLAVVFGNELEGVSDDARRGADEVFTIPMSGFAESFNISVAASIVLHELRRRREKAGGGAGDLSSERRDAIRAVWYMKSVREARRIVERELEDGYQPAGT